MPRLPPSPELDWTTEGAPRAAAFDDVYFSRRGGLAESEAVFLHGCGLPEAWRNKQRFSICELGFGTGLNVLAAWRAWKKTRSPHAILHISSIEAFPLAVVDAARALESFPDVSELAARLIECWPVRAYAPQRFWFPEDGFALTLHVGEAAQILAQMDARYDAWFLDGFAPSRNPEMWSEVLIGHVARLSAPGARVASFTVAGGVRRALAAAGFAVEKKPGFGSKKERLEARLAGPVARDRGEGGFRPFPYAACFPKRVAVLGAGIAGAACAQALTRRGVETVVLDAARAPAAGASGNPAGIVMPRLDRGGGALSEVFLAAFIHAVRTYEAFGGSVFNPCGVEERPLPGAAAAMADLLADPPLPEDWYAPLQAGAALHVRGGVLRPAVAIELMLRDATLLSETHVDGLEWAGDGWILRADGGRAVLKADGVILACGAALARFEHARFLPVQLSRGQIEWGRGRAPPRALTQGSYIAPHDGGVVFGATFDVIENESTIAADEKSRTANLEKLRAIAPDLAASIDSGSLQSRAAVRATTPDRSPIAGLLPNAEAWLTRRQGHAPGRMPGKNMADSLTHSGLYVLGGLGARGLTLAPLLGERIAAEMCGEPHQLSRAALDAIHPARFLYRRLRRGG